MAIQQLLGAGKMTFRARCLTKECLAERGEAAVDNYGVVKLSDLINLGETLQGEVEEASQ